MIYETIPARILSNEEKIRDNKNQVILDIDFLATLGKSVYRFRHYIGDLSKYYQWAERNEIEIDHSIIRTGHETIVSSKSVKVMFIFQNSEGAMAFKLRWK